AIQIPPVPSRAGKRKVALGPQLPAVFPSTTFRTTFLTSGAATRSPSHSHCIYRTLVSQLFVVFVHGAYPGGWHSPHFVVVGSHEDVSNTNASHAQNPLVKVLWFGVCDAAFDRRIDHAVQTLHLIFFWQHRDIVLEGIRYP